MYFFFPDMSSTWEIYDRHRSLHWGSNNSILWVSYYEIKYYYELFFSLQDYCLSYSFLLLYVPDDIWSPILPLLERSIYLIQKIEVISSVNIMWRSHCFIGCYVFLFLHSVILYCLYDSIFSFLFFYFSVWYVSFLLYIFAIMLVPLPLIFFQFFTWNPFLSIWNIILLAFYSDIYQIHFPLCSNNKFCYLCF